MQNMPAFFFLFFFLSFFRLYVWSDFLEFFVCVCLLGWWSGGVGGGSLGVDRNCTGMI